MSSEEEEASRTTDKERTVAPPATITDVDEKLPGEIEHLMTCNKPGAGAGGRHADWCRLDGDDDATTR